MRDRQILAARVKLINNMTNLFKKANPEASEKACVKCAMEVINALDEEGL